MLGHHWRSQSRVKRLQERDRLAETGDRANGEPHEHSKRRERQGTESIYRG